MKHSNKYTDCLELRRMDELIEKYYEKGDFITCFKGCLELAEKEYPLAECQVGYFYLTGQGIEKNIEKALYWTERAAEHGDIDAKDNLAEIKNKIKIQKEKTIIVREINESELDQLLKLYTQMDDNKIPEDNEKLKQLKKKIINDDDYHIIVAVEEGKIISSCVCVVIPNFTHEQRPYAFVENVITDINHRKMGLASSCLDYAKSIAVKNNCYKMMLMTGSKRESTLNFYEQAGYNRKDKTAFVQWI